MDPHSGGKAGVQSVSLLVQTALQELEGPSVDPHRVVRARGVGRMVGWGLRLLILSAAMCGCLLMAKSTRRRSGGLRLQLPLFLFQKNQHRCSGPPLPLSILAESILAHCNSPDIIRIILIRQ